jgi:hypothetical protein
VLTAGPTRHIKFSKPSFDIPKRIPETQLRFSIQSDVIILQIHQQFIIVIYFSFLRCWPHPKTPFVFLFLVNSDARRMKPAAAMRVFSTFPFHLP